MNYATGLFNLARNIGGSSGIATVTTLLARRSQMHQQVLVSHLTPYDPAYRNAIEHTTQLLHAHGASMPDAARQAADFCMAACCARPPCCPSPMRSG